MPDDGESPATAVAEAPTTLVPEPPQVEQAPEEAAPEPSPEETDSGPAQDEPVDVRSQLKGTLDEIFEAYPDLRPEAPQQERQDTGDDVELARLQLDRERRMSQWDSIYSQQQQALAQKVSPAFQELARHTQEIADGTATNLSPDVMRRMVESVSTTQQEAANLGAAYADAQNAEYILEALESHPARRLLSEEDRGKLAAVTGTRAEVITAHVHAYLDAALKKGAPEEVKRAAKEAAENDVKLAESLLKLQSVFPKNGQRSPEPTPASGNAFEELEHLYATGEATPQQEQQYRQMRRQRGFS